MQTIPAWAVVYPLFAVGSVGIALVSMVVIAILIRARLGEIERRAMSIRRALARVEDRLGTDPMNASSPGQTAGSEGGRP